MKKKNIFFETVCPNEWLSLKMLYDELFEWSVFARFECRMQLKSSVFIIVTWFVFFSLTLITTRS